MTSDDDRIAYLAGDGAARLDDLDRADLDELKALLADPGVWDDPPAGLEDAVVAAVVAQAEAAPEATSSVPSLGGQRFGVRVRRPRAPWLRPAAILGALAGAAAVVVALLVATGGSEGDRLEAALAPTELVPGAYGTAVLTKSDSGWRIELDASRLPRLDGGRFYQAWLRNADNVLVPIGTFNEGEGVVLWAGVSPRDFPTLTVTEEAADGDQASSGRRVLVGPVTED